MSGRDINKFRADNTGEKLQRQTLPHSPFAFVEQSLYDIFFPTTFGPCALVPVSS